MYLNYSSTIFSTQLSSEAVPNTLLHIIPSVFEGVDTGLVYPVEQLANRVHIRKLPSLGKSAFLLAGGNAHFAGFLQSYPFSPISYEYRILPRSLTQIFAHRQAQAYEDIELICTDHSACASSLFVLDYCRYLLNTRDFKRVIVLSVEDAVSSMSVEFFKKAGVESVMTPSAFDEKNLGFNLGQGAVTAVFEKEPINDESIRLVDCYSASEDCRNPLGMREDGQGYQRAMNGLKKEDLLKVGVVKTHGSGTIINNIAEKAALTTCLSQNFVATSLKPRFGHTLGASGLLESIVLMLEMRETGQVPKILNRSEKDEVFLSTDTDAPPGYILALAAGMGNIYSACIWEPLT